MSEDFEDRFERHEEMIQALARVWRRQGEINEHMDAAIERLDSYVARQDQVNERLTLAIERIEATQADIKQLLATLIERSTNGRGA